jgi:hypothetical protein
MFPTSGPTSTDSYPMLISKASRRFLHCTIESVYHMTARLPQNYVIPIFYAMVLHGRTCGQRAACSTGRPGTAGRSPALPHGFTCWASLDRCPLFSVSASVPTPQLIGSGLSIITHDDLYDSLTTRRATSIGTSTRPTTQSQLRILRRSGKSVVELRHLLVRPRVPFDASIVGRSSTKLVYTGPSRWARGLGASIMRRIP